jgi:hypothetical protein
MALAVYVCVCVCVDRYDMLDFVHHIYHDIKQDGYQGVNISALYRDEVGTHATGLPPEHIAA